jgi:hypothetical protein
MWIGSVASVICGKALRAGIDCHWWFIRGWGSDEGLVGVRRDELCVGVGFYSLALKKYLAKPGLEFANQAAWRIRTVFVPPSMNQTFTVFFLSSLFLFTSLLGTRPTLESLAFGAQLLKAGLDGCELGSGSLQPATRLLLCLLSSRSPFFSTDMRLFKALWRVGEFCPLFDAGCLQHGVLGLDILTAFDGLLDGLFESAHLLFHTRIPRRVLLRGPLERRNFRTLGCLGPLGVPACRLECVWEGLMFGL